ncbi:MAG: M12 family metallo-peptidase, partial [Phycisphaerales bacterium]|nr:M12 family metallo-peptidase [Phycisphaerales bacterium]
LFTGANTGSTIGLAYLGAVCSTYEYGVVQSNCCGSFGCATDLSAHEMGHNWGSEHCSCPSWTMHPSLQCANRFTSESEAYIINYRNSHESCLTDTTPQGACCYGTTCLERSETDCEDTGGAFQGDGSDCDSVTCTGSTGACCTQSGSCITVTSSQCDTISGDYQGDNVPCDDEICIPQPEGACCIGTDCTVTEQADCGGTWLGEGTNCDDGPCSATSYAGIRHRIVGVNLVDAPQDTWTVDIYADAGAGERIDAVAGTTTQPKTIASSEGFWQHSFGGGVSTDVNPALFDAFPDLRYDSRVTIGSLDSSGDPFGANELNHIGIDFSTFENGGAISASDGTWFVLPTHEQGGAIGVEAHECDNVHGVLLARLTVFGHDSVVTVSALLQGRNELGNPWQVAADHTVSMSEFADCNGNNNNDACDIANGSSSDANGNGIPDECESTCPWDLDGDGDTDVDDLLAVISGFGSEYDVDDLLALLSEFGCG